MKRILRKGLLAGLILLFAASSASADMSGFAPLKNPTHGTDVCVTGNSTYYGDGGRWTTKMSAGGAKSGSIIAYDLDYSLQVEETVPNSSGKHWVSHGSIMKNDLVKKTAATIQGGINNSYWFNMKAGAAYPEVTYTGYRIWDPNKAAYVNLRIVYRVTDWNRKYRKSNNSKNKKKNFRATIGIGKKFNGMPTIDIVNIGSAAVTITFYDANTGAKYSPKYSLTYDDIDCYQAIGVRTTNCGGFTIHNNAQKSLIYESNYRGYNLINGNHPDNQSPEDVKYMASFNIKADGNGQVGMVYVSNQKDGKSIGVPNGRHAYFSARTYKKDVPPPPSTPTKRVYDEKSSNDWDVKNNLTAHTHNTVSGRTAGAADNEFFYTIQYVVPPGMQSFKYKNFEFVDVLDSCIQMDKDYKWQSGSTSFISGITKLSTGPRIIADGHDITGSFTPPGDPVPTGNGNRYTWSLKNGKHADSIYNGNSPCTVTLVIPCHFEAKEDIMAAHSAHPSDESMNYIDVPNAATVQLKFKESTTYIKKDTTTVKTRILKKVEKELVVVKRTTGTAPDSDKAFTFDVELNSGSEYGGYIKKQNGDEVELKPNFKSKGTYELKSNEELHLLGIPDDVTYTVTERASKGYAPSFRIDEGATGVTPDSVTGASGTAQRSQPITFKGTTKDVGAKKIVYEVTNERQPYTHDLIINKKVDGTATQNFNIQVKFYGDHVNLNTLLANTTVTTQGTASINSSNNSIDIAGVGHNTKITIGSIPDGAEYLITETGASGVKPGYVVTQGTEVVNSTAKNGSRGESLQTPKECFVTGEDKGLSDSYAIEYEITNTTRSTHDVEVTKQIAGEGADPEDVFSYTASFSSIPLNADNKYARFAAEITEGGEVIKKIKASSDTTAFYTQQFKLKAGQKITFFSVPETTQMTVMEKKNDYRPRVVYTNAAGQDAANQGEQYADLAASTTLPANDLKYTFAFTNTKDPEPYTNQLKVGKVATDGSTSPFNFTADLEGLDENTWYAAASTYGDTEYELVIDGTGIYAKNKANNEKVAGVAFTLTRPDGKQKTFLANGDGLLPKAQYEDWANVKAGDLDIDWVGGHYTGARYKYAVFDSEAKTLTFLESAEQHTNGEQDDTLTYYTGFETAKGQTTPNWYGKRSEIEKVVFETTVSPKTCYRWFYDMTKLTEIDNLDKLNTSSVQSLYAMFAGCTSLKKLDLSFFDTSGVTNMNGMFSDCTSLKKLDLSSFDTSGVTNMYSMFYHCASLEELDLSSFDTSGVTNMSFMFSGCSSLEHIYASERWNTNAVTSSANMFYNCTSLPDFDELVDGKTRANYDPASDFNYVYTTGSGYGRLTDKLGNPKAGVNIYVDDEAFSPVAETNSNGEVISNGSSDPNNMSYYMTLWLMVTLENGGEMWFDVDGLHKVTIEEGSRDTVKEYWFDPETPGGYLTYKEAPAASGSSGGNSGNNGDDNDESVTDNGTTFKGTITSFQADGSGNATVTFRNANDDTTTIEGLPEGASYVVTEAESGYKPGFALYRNETKTSQEDGKIGQALATEKETFAPGAKQNDYVEYVNMKNSFNLEVGKTTEGDMTKKFDFTINLSGLHEEEYTAKISGSKTAGIRMDVNGNITVSVVTGSAEGIPVKLIRPYDENSKTLYTDAEGKISADSFIGWLGKGQKKAYEFTVQWPGGETTGRFMIPAEPEGGGE